MRITWKDSIEYKTYKYRKHLITRYKAGWITNLPGDDNVYYSIDHALNSIDKILGGKTRKANPPRQKLGIKIIGKKEEGM